MSAPCPHGNAMSEHCWSCDADHTARAVAAERERVLRLLEAEISALPTNLYVASKLARAIARIRKGEP